MFPPKTWEELKKIASSLTRYNSKGEISQAGIALGGTSKTVYANGDIVSTLALQDEVSSGGEPETEKVFGSKGETAINTYKEFSKNWSEDMPYSPDAFRDGRVAMMLGYASVLKNMKEKSVFVDPQIAAIPQIDEKKAVTYTKYWGYAVSNQSAKKNLAWEFLTNLTTNQSFSESYMKATGKPPALNSLIEAYKNDETFGVFVKQALIAFSLPSGNALRLEEKITQSVDEAILGNISSKQAIEEILR